MTATTIGIISTVERERMRERDLNEKCNKLVTFQGSLLFLAYFKITSIFENVYMNEG